MSNKKNLLIYAHYYIPDTASTGQILRELAEGMLDRFNITVICVVPSYLGTIEEKYKTQKYYEEEINGVKVLRIRVPEFSKTNKKSRVKNILSYFFGAMGATFKVGKMDYVFSISQPPILGGLLGVWGKWMKHAKYIRCLIYLCRPDGKADSARFPEPAFPRFSGSTPDEAYPFPRPAP